MRAGVHKKFLKGLAVLLWPEVCPFCGCVSQSGVCQECRKAVEKLKFKGPCCMRCGRTIRYAEEEYCPECKRITHVFDQGHALWRHQKPVSSSVYQFKFHNQRAFASYYAKEMISEYRSAIERWGIDLLLPVPLHPGRRRARGYNQAELLARELGKNLGLPAESGIVLRIRSTTPQKELGRWERKQNLADAFAMRRQDVPKVRGKNVCLVDDIYTTGSTMDAVAEVLREAGVNRVYFLTVSAGNY